VANVAHGWIQEIALDPRNVWLLQQLCHTYTYLRRYDDMAGALHRAIAASPDDAVSRVARALVDLEWRADTEPARQVIHAVVAEDPSAVEAIAEQWFHLALCRRDPTEMARSLASIPPEGSVLFTVRMPKSFCEGIAARARADACAAEAASASARAEMAKLVDEQPEYAHALSVLGMSEAGLGNRHDALTHGRRAVELFPITKDAMAGAKILRNLVITQAWAGEKELAIQQLAEVVQLPSPVSHGQLRLHPWWDPLRDDPRFEQLVAEARNPVALK
jgi:tetratricopeptide (TPR) repeat protein